MDIQRPPSNAQRNKKIAATTAVITCLVSLTLLALGISSRPPGVDGDTIFWDEVRRGEFLYQVTAQGRLHAPEIRSVTTQSDGVVEVINVLPGHKVGPNDVLMVISSPNLLEDLADARAELESVEADEYLRQSNATDQLLRLQSDLADAEDSYEEATYRAESAERLYAQNAVSEAELMRDVNLAGRAERRRDIALQLVTNYPDKLAAEEAQALSRLDRQRRKVERLEDRARNLEVRAGFDGVVQEVAVEVGQRLSSGAEVARIVNPHYLIARVRVSERDEPLVQIGQSVSLEMGRQSITGRVSRKDPAAVDGLVTVDVEIVSESAHQLRPDVSVTGRIRIERVADTLVVNRPPYIRDGHQRMDLFRLDENGDRAERISAEIGRVSVREMEVLSGVVAGDRILQSDMTDWLDEPLIRIH